ncbi:MAG: ectoine/hydroxyectoine ABC transporter ATP-binding protein EhuA [Mesorhizobium sp.]
MTPAVGFKGVSKRFGPTVVLDDFDFEVAAGEKVAILGPSGSGKSTLLRILMTLESIDDGIVCLQGDTLWHRSGGADVEPRPQHSRLRSRVGMVFQQFNLFPHMTALQNVAAALVHVQGRPRAEAEETARKLLDQVGLGNKLDSYPARLSGGQQQRVAIARAMALKPSVMLFDEPTSALDPELVGEVLDVMRSLAHAHDLTMMVVTHQLGVAKAIADRVCFMESGRLVEEGTPDAFFGNPQNERTRNFLRSVALA